MLVQCIDRPRDRQVALMSFPIKITPAYVGVFVFLALSLLLVLLSFVPHQQPHAAPDWVARTEACRNDMAQSFDGDKSTAQRWDDIATVCYTQVRGEALLADFSLRRSNLINQQSEGRIVLWMVVAITISGVALAGLQLLAAYRLAGAGHGELAASQEVTLEQNKISLKSSVTGLMILVISFAFFMVYIAWVYTAKELKQEFPEAAKTIGRPDITNNTTLTPGGYGAPSTSPVPPADGSKRSAPPQP
jgi:hypothetical protein